MNIKDILRALLIVIMTVDIPPHALPQSDADDEINRLKTIYGDGPEYTAPFIILDADRQYEAVTER